MGETASAHEEENGRKYSRDEKEGLELRKREGAGTAEEKDQKGGEAENWLKERRSREDYDLEPQAEREEEGMKKYSGSKKTGPRDGERCARRALEGRGITKTKNKKIFRTPWK